MTSRAGILLHAIGVTARISAPTVVEAIRGVQSDHELFDRRLDGWSRDLLEEVHVTLDVEGADTVPAGEVVIMSNHASLWFCLRSLSNSPLLPLWTRACRSSILRSRSAS